MMGVCIGYGQLFKIYNGLPYLDYNSLMMEQQRTEDYQEDIIFNRKISELSNPQLRYTYSNASNTSDYSYDQKVTSTIEQFKCKFIRDQQLYSDILQQLTKVKELTCIDNQDACLYLYHLYHWNTQQMGEFFNQDWQEEFKLRINSRIEEKTGWEKAVGFCGVCLEETKLYSSGMCDHQYCSGCWQSYIKNELQSGRIFFSCMSQVSCQRAPILSGFVSLVAPKMKELFRKKVLVSYAIQNKDICYCPKERCPIFCYKPTMMQLNEVKCPCGQLYCFKCEQQPHAPASCRDVQRWKQLLSSSQTNQSWIKNNTRECPQCHQPIEKKVGCSHMKCICLCEFCYECNREWDGAHRELKGECPFRSQLKSRQKLTDRVSELQSQLNLMMREAQKHQTSLHLCQTLVKEQTLLAKVIEVKVEVMCAWLTLKWTKIVLTLSDSPEIEVSLQQQFVKSIRDTMQPVAYIIRNNNVMGVRDLQQYGQSVLAKKQVLRRHKSVWLQAYEVRTESY